MARRSNPRRKQAHDKALYINYHTPKQNTKHTEEVNEAKTFVTNLSKHKLTDPQYLLLAKGIKFIPTPLQHNHKREIILYFMELARKMHSKYQCADPETKSPQHHIRTNSGYEPPTGCNALETYISNTREELAHLENRRIRPNTTREERVHPGTQKQQGNCNKKSRQKLHNRHLRQR